MTSPHSYKAPLPTYTIKPELAMATSEGVLLYAGTPVSSERGTLTLKAGTYNFNGNIETITRQQALEIWQQVYLHVRPPFEPEDCAYVLREVRGICHTCYGDAVLDDTDEICPDCKGTGYNVSR